MTQYYTCILQAKTSTFEHDKLGATENDCLLHWGIKFQLKRKTLFRKKLV